MRRALQAMVFASLLFATGCGDASDGYLIGASPSPVASATETGELRELTAAVCEPSSEPCEDTRMSGTDGSCTTNLGRDCVEADADHALRRWLHGPRGGPDGAGDAELLAVLDQHTVVIGYAFGADLTFAGAQVQEADDRVTVLMTFDSAPTTTDDGQPAASTMDLGVGREIMRIPTPIGRRPIEIDVESRPSP